jgi:uncharacterized protein YraI
MRTLLIAALGAMMIIAFKPTTAHASWTAYVVTDLNMRTGPGTGFGRITVIPVGAAVRVYACPRNWCHISYRGREGYVSARYITTAQYRAPRHRYYTPPPVYIPRPYYRSHPYYRYPAPRYRNPYYGRPGYRFEFGFGW